LADKEILIGESLVKKLGDFQKPQARAASVKEAISCKTGAGDGLRTRDPQLGRLESIIYRTFLIVPKKAC